MLHALLVFGPEISYFSFIFLKNSHQRLQPQIPPFDTLQPGVNVALSLNICSVRFQPELELHVPNVVKEEFLWKN
jgi:hypothetical protein